MPTCGVIFDVAGRQKKIDVMEKLASAPDFWNDNEKAQTILKQSTEQKSWVEAFNKIDKQYNDILELISLLEDEEDEETELEVENDISLLGSEIDDLEFRNMLSGDDDKKDAILTIHPGAGGTESQDWASMLFRMYVRWIERKGFKQNIMDLQNGDEAGLKSVTLEIKGDYSFGFLKAENGVHRLVRISPFDSNSRRHTSFASVFVIPEIGDDIEIDINPNDLRVDTYRASGAGGQHVNKTDSAVRITHVPTGIVVQCQNERSQHKNRANALKILKARLYQKKKEEEEEKRDALESSKQDIAWGSQIRSYVMHPYNMVKDHRTKTETGNVQAVMEGDIDMFIKNYLMMKESL